MHCPGAHDSDRCIASVEDALRKASLPYEEEIQIAAGVMVLHNLLFSMAAAAGELDIESKDAELRCLEALATGSETHVYASLHFYLQTLISYGEPSIEEERSQERVTDAHVVRYNNTLSGNRLVF